MADTVLILPAGPAPAGGAPGPVADTPFGPVVGFTSPEGLPVFLREESTDARALIYAAKALGARRVLAGEFVQAVSPLLEPGDIVIPADVIDQTRLRPFTFFVGKGYGFIKLNPPCCPDLMAAALAVARERQSRSFKGGVYVCTEGPRDATPAELRMFRQWGADLVGTRLLPETYLARELELHYVAITIVGGEGNGDLYGLLRAVAAAPSAGVPCTCDETMKFSKELGTVGEDWRTWL